MRFRSALSRDIGFFERLLLRTYELSVFIVEFFKRFWRRPYELKELFNQMDEAGTRSFLLTSVTGLSIGVVLAM